MSYFSGTDRLFAALRNIAIAITVVAAAGVPCYAASYSGSLPEAGVAWISDGSNPTALPESQMRNAHKAFIPDFLVITVGSAVRFPNEDDFFHSIYSESSPNTFDIGFYDNGPGKVVTFSKPGVVAIRCHIHGTMHATIVVVNGPWAQTHDPNEKYTLTDVRPGNYVLHTWSPATGEKTTPVKV
jgi:plastocyanin